MTKRRSDKDYSFNQADANDAWNTRNPEYWKRYRAQRLHGDLSTGDLQTLLADALRKHFEDVSSSDGRTARPRRKLVSVLGVVLPLGEDSPLSVKLRIEIHASWKKASSKVRKETTS